MKISPSILVKTWFVVTFFLSLSCEFPLMDNNDNTPNTVFTPSSEQIVEVDGHQYAVDEHDEIWRLDSQSDMWKSGFREDMFLLKLGSPLLVEEMKSMCDSLSIQYDSLGMDRVDHDYYFRLYDYNDEGQIEILDIMKILDNKFINYNYYYDDNSIDLIHDGMEDIIIIDGQKYIQDNFDELWRYDNINDNWEKGFRDDMILVQVAAETMLNTFYDFCDSLGVVCDSLDYHALEDYSYEQGLYYFISFPNTQDIINVMKAFEKFEHHDFRGRIISLIDVLEYSSSTPEIAHIGFNTYTYYPNGLSTLYLNSNQDRHIKYELLPDRFIIYSDSSVYETKIETLCETLSCDIIDVKGNVYLLEKNGQKTLINIMKEFESHDEKFSVQGISEESFETLEKIDHYYYMMVDGHVFVPFSYMSDRISGNLFGVTFKEGVTDNQVKNLSDSLNVEIVRQNSSTVSNGCVMEIKAYQNIIDIMKVYYDSNLFDRVGIVRLYTAL